MQKTDHQVLSKKNPITSGGVVYSNRHERYSSFSEEKHPPPLAHLETPPRICVSDLTVTLMIVGTLQVTKTYSVP